MTDKEPGRRRRETAKNLKEKVIDRPSSVGPETSEVLSMKKQVESGRPTSAYEFAQGMVDYGSGHQPPPRINMVYSDGHREIFSGKIKNREGIAAVEFVNSGPGLAPEDTVIIHHDPNVDQTLGQHGRGTTITLAYLESEGIHTEIESNKRDPETDTEARAWQVTTSLKDTEAGKTKTVHVTGKWLNKTSNQTTFRVLNPTKGFLDQVDRLPEYFLPANPRSPEASVVEKDPAAPQVSLAYEVSDPLTKKKAQVRCLLGIVDFPEQDRNNVFVDGLKVENQYSHEKCVFPWSISGARDLQENVQIGRSYDSKSVTGRGKVGTLLQIALRHNENPQIFDRLVTEAERLADQYFGGPLELDESSASHIPLEMSSMGEKTKATLHKVWQDKHGEAYVANSKDAVQKFKKSGTQGEAVAVQKTMYGWLKESGVKTVADAGIVEGKAMRSGNNIRVEYANDPDRLEKLFMEAGRFEGTVRVVRTNGKKAVEIRFPYSISREEDFEDRHKPGAQFARVATIIAAKEGLEINIHSHIGRELANLEFKIGGWSRGTSFDTKLEALQSTIDPLPNSLANGLTTIVLRGDKLQQLEPPIAENLQAIAEKEALETMKKRAEAVANVPRKSREIVAQERAIEAAERGKVSRRKFLKFGAAGAAAAAGAVALYYSENLLDLLPRITPLSNDEYERKYKNLDPNKIGGGEAIGVDHGSLGVHELDYRNAPDRKNQSVFYERGTEGRDIDGYYREFVGSKFVVDGNGRGRWISIESYQDQPTSVGKPDRYLSKITMLGLNGQRRLPVRNEEGVFAIDTKIPVKVKKEGRTGDYVVEGLLGKEKLDVYIGEVKPNTVPPIADELESIIDFQSLDSDWQILLSYLQTNKALSESQKTALIMQKWSAGFVYVDDSKYDSIAQGKTAKQVITNIANNRLGMCNFAAAGIIGLLREAGIPAREVTGKTVDTYGKEGLPHAWAEFWDGKQWQELEPLIKSVVIYREETLRSQTAVNQNPNQEKINNYLDSVSQSAQARTTDDLLRKNAKILDKYKELLKNPPAKLKKDGQPTKPEEPAPTVETTKPQSPQTENKGSSVPLKEVGLLGIGAAIGAGITKWLERVRKVREEYSKKDKT